MAKTGARTLFRAALYAPLSAALLSIPSGLFAQATAPSSVTPPTLRPAEPNSYGQITIPAIEGLHPPAGAQDLFVTPGPVSVAGSFTEVSRETAAIIAHLQGQRVSLAQIYAAASAIEQAHARAGFVLVRVAVPPQQLVDGGPLRIVVIDGFIESVDVSGVPARVRGAVLARVAALKQRHHVTLGDIEQPLLIANGVPGLTMTSTLARGTEDGGTRLILAGQQRLISGSLGGDNSLSATLGTYSVNAQISINSAFGLGEQLYGLASSGYDVSRFFGANVPVRVLGGGVVLPLGDGRLTLNPEVTFARTQPMPAAGTPQSRGDLRRLTLRGDYVLRKTRAQSLDLIGAVEQIDETNTLLGFAPISHDRFMVARAGISVSAANYAGASLGGSLQLSHGLGSLGALDLADLPAVTTFSRQGAAHDFTKLNAALNARAPLGSGGLQITVTGKAQTSFGDALLRAEQASLEGADAVSGLVGGVSASDSAVSLRGELGKAFALPGPAQANLAPYAFAAGGIGWIARPTAVEQAQFKGASLGGGARLVLLRYGFSIAGEYAHSFTDIPGLRHTDRVNFTTAIRF